MVEVLKKGSVITLYESLGIENYTIEDYLGKNYIEIKTILEQNHGLVVTIEKKDIPTPSEKEYGEQEIIGQSLEKGTKVEKGDAITLYIPNIVDSYPDMVFEEWTLDDVKAFCDKYKITLTYDEKESSDHKKGRVTYQSRSPKTPIIEGSTLKVTIAKEVSEGVNPGEPPKEENNGETEKEETNE